MNVIIDGQVFGVGAAKVERSVRRLEKYRVTTEDGRMHREVQSTYIDFSLSLGNFGKEEYDRLMEYLRTAAGDVTVELPRGARDNELYTGSFDEISDEVITEDDEGVFWDNLELRFVGTVPVEV